jgi:Zn-dependent hydrolases, including glyoxylases
MWFASKPQLPEGTAVDEQLAKLGISPSSLDYVILTHMDIDHCSGLRLVKDAKKILISEDEQSAIKSRQVRYAHKPFSGISIETIVYEENESLPFGKSWDVFGDGTVLVVATPGHSQGSLSIKVTNGDNYALIVGDTGYNSESWTKLNLPGPVYSKNDMLISLKWVASHLNDERCKAILCAHDPSEKTKQQMLKI